jgi:hypothetical protein
VAACFAEFLFEIQSSRTYRWKALRALKMSKRNGLLVENALVLKIPVKERARHDRERLWVANRAYVWLITLT